LLFQASYFRSRRGFERLKRLGAANASAHPIF
jgi:hypothetical protein